MEILQRYPNIHYTALELNHRSQQTAREALQDAPHVQFLGTFGEHLSQEYRNHFDITLSLSVLEHVKHWRAFLSKRVQVTRPGGLIIHRYDLGHALHSSLYERSKVFLCQHLPWTIPKSHFTFHPNQEALLRHLQTEHLTIQEIQYAQMPNLKVMLNRLNWKDDEAYSLRWKVSFGESFFCH